MDVEVRGRYGLPETSTDTNGQVIRTTYDALGRVDTVTGPTRSSTVAVISTAALSRRIRQKRDNPTSSSPPSFHYRRFRAERGLPDVIYMVSPPEMGARTDGDRSASPEIVAVGGGP